MAEKDWELVEKLAASFEHVLAPQGAKITLSDYIPDKDTGEPRQVDVSIRYQIGSVPILITVESRDRSKTEDSTWIEQLADRKRAIGANATIAVSTSGFSKPAQMKAERCGIELRHVGSIKDADIEKWFTGIFLTVAYLTYELTGIGLDWPNDEKPAEIPDGRIEIKLKDAWKSPIFRDGPKGVSAEELLEGHWESFQRIQAPAVGRFEQRVIALTLNPEIDLYFPYRGKNFLVRRVELILNVGHYREKSLLANLTQYTKGDKVLGYAGHAKVTAGLDEPIDFVILKKPDSGTITVAGSHLPWWKRKKKKKKGRK
jgi:hypothetical protein